MLIQTQSPVCEATLLSGQWLVSLCLRSCTDLLNLETPTLEDCRHTNGLQDSSTALVNGESTISKQDEAKEEQTADSMAYDSVKWKELTSSTYSRYLPSSHPITSSTL